MEIRRPVVYNNKFRTVRIGIRVETSEPEGYMDLSIELGHKYDRMVKLQCTKYNFYWKLLSSPVKLYQYTPILPRFPYNLRLELTTDQTFLVYVQGIDEPLIRYSFEEKIISVMFLYAENIDQINNNEINSDASQKLVALFDCSLIGAPNCGDHRIDSLIDCRESLNTTEGFVSLLNAATSENDDNSKIIDEYFVVDPSSIPRLRFDYSFPDSIFEIEIRPNSIIAHFYEEDEEIGRCLSIKTATSSKHNEIPESPRAIRVEMIEDADNSCQSWKISNIRGDEILNVKIPQKGLTRSLYLRQARNTSIYFDCVLPDIFIRREREIKYSGSRRGVTFNETGYNFTKGFFDTHDYVENPPVVYEDKFEQISTEDWCEGDRLPEVVLDKNEILDVNKITQEILSKLESQYNATAAGFKAILCELWQLRTNRTKRSCRISKPVFSIR